MEITKNIIVADSPAEAALKATELFEQIVKQTVDANGKCCIALAGGNTPKKTYELLANRASQSNLPWDKIEFFIGDERDVPHDDIDSNIGMIYKVLLEKVPVDPEKIHPMFAHAEDIDQAADDYEKIICKCVEANSDEIPAFDLIMLGLGGDGHTASLFPETLALEETEKLVVPNFVPVLGRNRMTMTYRLLNAAKNIMFIVTGPDKAHMVKRVFEQHDPILPASNIRPTSGEIHLILDKESSDCLQ